MKKKLILVTGVSSGIGYQVAKELLGSGYRVLGVNRSASDKTKLLAETYPDSFYFETLDLVENIDGLPKWVRNQSNNYGLISGLVHSAGVQQILPLQFNSYSKMLEVFNLNLFSGLSLAKGVSDKRVACPEGMSIVFVSSIASKTGESGLVNYAASKAALNGAMRVMAKELASRKIRVNSVLPGFVMTEMIEKWKEVYSQNYIDTISEKYPLGIGKPENVSSLVCYLLSDEAAWITGSELDVNGGASLGA